MSKYDVAAIIWPSYTGDERRTHMFWPEGMGEWETVKNCTSKAPEQIWPRKPLWGYVNEANPDVMEMQINCALRHGVNVFIYDWYWYDDRPFLENCLNDGFLKAPNNEDMKFYLMWANHDATHLWDRRISDDYAEDVIWDGKVDFERFTHVVHRVIDNYFCKPNYYKIDGKPVFMIYELFNLIKGLGSPEETFKALEYFREETVKAGYPGLHLQANCPSMGMFRRNPDLKALVDETKGFSSLGYDSFTNYQYRQMTDTTGDYLEVLERIKQKYKDYDELFPATPYFPQVSIGWDNTPRFTKNQPMLTTGSCPENFEKGLLAAKEYVDTHDLPVPLITINSWNEWTEGSYLEPDNLTGYGYLEAVKKVFKDQ